MFHRPGGVSKGDHHAHGPDAVQGLEKGGSAHPVVHHVNAAPLSDLPEPGREILFLVEDGVVAAVGRGRLSLRYSA